MEKTAPRVGIFVCECGGNIGDVVNVKKVVDTVKNWEDVVVAKHHKYLCSRPAQEMIVEAIKKHELDRVVIASCTPRMHLSTFQSVLERAGLNPYMLEFVNIREQDSWVHGPHPSEEATRKAISLIRGGYERSLELEPLESISEKCSRDILIIGGGIAGITAALELGYLGFKVHLVERKPSIGGNMAKLTKVFPTLDCAQCILTPRMAEVGRNPNVDLLTYAEVQEVAGRPGNYVVKVFMKPRGVDVEKCRSCGVCAKVCPVVVPDEYNEGLCERKAAYIPFPQAVPSAYAIDFEACSKCGKCEQLCPAKAINLNDEGKVVELNVGAIIVAVGSDIFNAEQIWEYGYKRFPNVISNIQFERLSNAAGPTNGKILCPQKGKPPKSIAFIQCVGSRDERFNKYCCRVGCMISLKQAILAKEKLGEEVDVYICFNDIRAFGKGYEEFYRKAREMGVQFIVGIPSEIHQQQDGSLYFDVYDSSTNKLLAVNADLVVLATGLVPSPDFEKLQSILRISRSPDGFFLEAHPKLRPLETTTKGIFLAGTCQGPKDIPDTVAQASGAAAKAADLLATGEIEIEPLIGIVDEELCSGCGVCKAVCAYDAIEIKPNDEGELKAEIVEALCQGCGSCATACPVKAIKMQHYTDQQILAQVHAFLPLKAEKGGKQT